MALIACPECGKENISDSAEICPVCGYPVKHHFEKEREQEAAEKKFQNEISKLDRECTAELKEIDKLPYPPQKPVLSQYYEPLEMLCLILCSFFDIVILLACCFISWFYVILLIFLLIITWGIWSIGHDRYQDALNSYEEQIADWNAYKAKRKKEIVLKYNTYKNNMKVHGNRFAPVDISRGNIPTCPMCGSIFIKKISNMDRTTSVAILGLASSKIGKQYECETCKHKW